MCYGLNNGLNSVSVTEIHWKTDFRACLAGPLQDNAFNAEYLGLEYYQTTTRYRAIVGNVIS